MVQSWSIFLPGIGCLTATTTWRLLVSHSIGLAFYSSLSRRAIGWAVAWPESYNTGWGNGIKVHAVPIPSTIEFVEISLPENTAKCLPTQRFRALNDEKFGIALNAL